MVTIIYDKKEFLDEFKDRKPIDILCEKLKEQFADNDRIVMTNSATGNISSPSAKIPGYRMPNPLFSKDAFDKLQDAMECSFICIMVSPNKKSEEDK
jgi:hypothetical protein